MDNMKYDEIHEQHSVVSEPVGMCIRNSGTGIPICDTTDSVHDKTVDYSTMPCVYTDEEFEAVLRESEENGYATIDDMREMYAKWGAKWEL